MGTLQTDLYPGLVVQLALSGLITRSSVVSEAARSVVETNFSTSIL